MKKYITIILLVLLVGCGEKEKADYRDGGTVISAHEGYLDGHYVKQKTVELPDDWVDTTQYKTNGCGGMVVCGADSVWCRGDTLFYIYTTQIQDTIIVKN